MADAPVLHLHFQEPLEFIETFIQNIRHPVSTLRNIQAFCKSLREKPVCIQNVCQRSRGGCRISSVISRVVPSSPDIEVLDILCRSIVCYSFIILKPYCLSRVTAFSLKLPGILLFQLHSASLKIQRFAENLAQTAIYTPGYLNSA